MDDLNRITPSVPRGSLGVPPSPLGSTPPPPPKEGTPAVRSQGKEMDEKDEPELKGMSKYLKPGSIKTGRKGLNVIERTTGLKKRFQLMRHGHAEVNLSKSDTDHFTGIIQKHAFRLQTGSEFDRRVKRDMKLDAYKLWREGKISKSDLNDFKNIVKNL